VPELLNHCDQDIYEKLRNYDVPLAFMTRLKKGHRIAKLFI
jgi:hypothetical protein